jgi:TnsA endonuclease N terminal
MYLPIPMKRSMKYGNNFWHGYSYKVKRDTYFFSDLEYEHWMIVETNPHIVDFCEQPLEIKYFYNGKLRSSIFDMWVKYDNGQEEFREVKYQSHLEKAHPKYEETIKQITIQKEWCRTKGFPYSVQTDEKIRCNPLWVDNCRILISYVRMAQPKHITLLQEIIEAMTPQPCSIQQLSLAFKQVPLIDIQIAIFLGVYMGRLIAPLKESQITQFMEVQKNV